MSKNRIGIYWDKRYDEDPYIWGKDRSEAADTLHKLVLFGGIENKTLDILEVGCGPGRDVLYYVKQGNNATGLDLSGGALAIAKRDYDKMRMQRLVGQATFIQGTIHELDQSAPRFDVILSHLVAHVWDQERLKGFATAAGNLLKDGGKLIVGAFNADAFDPNKEVWQKGEEGYIACWKGSGRPSAFFFERPIIEEVFTKDFHIDRIRHTVSAPHNPDIATPINIMIATRLPRMTTHL